LLSCVEIIYHTAVIFSTFIVDWYNLFRLP